MIRFITRVQIIIKNNQITLCLLFRKGRRLLLSLCYLVTSVVRVLFKLILTRETFSHCQNKKKSPRLQRIEVNGRNLRQSHSIKVVKMCILKLTWLHPSTSLLLCMNLILVSVAILLDLTPWKFLTSTFITLFMKVPDKEIMIMIMIILFNLSLSIKIFNKGKIPWKKRINNSRQTLALDFLLCSRVITMLKYLEVNGKFMNRIKEIWKQVHFLWLIQIWIKRKLLK